MTAAIPNRPVFRAQEVCDIAQVQLYVLRSWEAEFPDLGVAKKAGDHRVYRRADVERVLQLKHLLFVDGLTLAGARKRLGVDAASVPMAVPDPRAPKVERASTRSASAATPISARSDEATTLDADIAAMLDEEARQSLRDVRRGLHWILGVLNGHAVPEDRIVLPRMAASARTASRSTARPAARPRARAMARKPTRSSRRSAKGRRK